MKGKIFFMAGMACLAHNFSAAQFTMSGEVRPRTEYRHGFKSLAAEDQKAAVFTDQRTRLNLTFKNEVVTSKIVLQDVRVWGNQRQLNGNEDFATSIHEAWGQAKLSESWSLKLGRQEISYDDQRFLGAVGWAQQARSHDAALLKYGNDKLKLDFGFAYNQSAAGLIGTNYITAGNYKTIQYVWGNYKVSDELSSSFLVFNNGLQVTSGTEYWDNYSQTLGLMPVYKKGKFKGALNAYYQMGSGNTTPVTNIAAALIGVDLLYKVKDSLHLIAGYEIQSGNSQTETEASYYETNHAFTPFYGTNHKFNGLMDYFYVGNHIGSVGLQDIYIKAKYITKKATVGLDIHSFLAAAEVLDQDAFATDGTIQALDAMLGTEIDLSLATKLADGVGLKAGYSHMLGTETLVALKGGSLDAISNWGYVMVIFKPKFIQ